MESSLKAPERALMALGTPLLWANLALQLLNGLTSFIALQRGFTEINPYTLWLIGEVGNAYLGVGVQTLLFMGLFVLVFYLARAVAGAGDGKLRVLGLGVVDVTLVFFALSFAQAVLSNVSLMIHLTT
jgi:hypothetical protein